MFRPARKRWGNGTRKRVCNATYLAKDPAARPRKLDYICISNRWKSMMKNSRVKWGPSIHRFGQKFDHGLLSATWHWKTRKTQRKETFDFQRMTNQSWRSFDEKLRMKLQEKYEHVASHVDTEVTPVTRETTSIDNLCVDKPRLQLK